MKDSWFSHIYWVLGKIVMVASAIITMCFYSPILMGISLIICAFTAFVSVKINKSIKKYAENGAKEINEIIYIIKQYHSRVCNIKNEFGSLDSFKSFL